jgi:hypothetical protein
MAVGSKSTIAHADGDIFETKLNQTIGVSERQQTYPGCI